MGVRLPLKPKPDNCTEPCNADMAEIRGEDYVLTRGGLADAAIGQKVGTRSKTCCKKSAEAIVAVEPPSREGLNQARWE